MAKSYDGRFKAECSFCTKKAAIPARGADSFFAALLKAGSKFGIHGKELKFACPNPDCQKKLTIFVEDGIIQPNLPGTEEEAE